MFISEPILISLGTPVCVFRFEEQNSEYRQLITEVLRGSVDCVTTEECNGFRRMRGNYMILKETVTEGIFLFRTHDKEYGSVPPHF